MSKERPILFNGPMVRALLEGRKTQTRRIVKAAKDPNIGCWMTPGEIALDSTTVQECISPYGQPGDRLWVRETFQRFTDDGETIYRADQKSFDLMNDLKRDECLEARWRPAIHMPRWASRILLEVVSVRVERLNDISEADSIVECLQRTQDGHAWHVEDEIHRATSPVDSYASLWEAINGPGSWDANPWVWVVEFSVAAQAKEQ